MSMDLIKIGEGVQLELKQQNIQTPDNYSVANALKSAYLILRDTRDKNDVPVYESCSETSIHNAFLSMAVQGLDPIKDQCYFIPYNGRLELSRSYRGSVAVLKRVDSKVKTVTAEVIYKGDTVKTEIIKGRRHITKHEQNIENIITKPENIIAAYANALDHDDNVIASDFMTIDNIIKAWSHSTMQRAKDPSKRPILANGQVNPHSNHGKHPDRYSRRTLINRLCKDLISQTDDTELLRAFKATDEEAQTIDILNYEVQEQANKKLIDFDKAKNKDQSSGPQPATIEQARMITGLSQELDQKDKMMGEVSSFFNRSINKLSELTFDEANQYLDILNDQIKDAKESPDWG